MIFKNVGKPEILATENSTIDSTAFESMYIYIADFLEVQLSTIAWKAKHLVFNWKFGF